MNLQRQLSDWAQRFDNHGAERDIRDEMAVHDIHMDAVRSTAFRFGDLLAQTRKIGREYRRGNFDVALAHGFPNSTRSGFSFHTVVFGWSSFLWFLLHRGC